MTRQLKVGLNGKVWQMGEKTFLAMVDAAVSKLRSEDFFAIVAVGREDTWTMEKTIFLNAASLERSASVLRQRGLTVITTEVWDGRQSIRHRIDPPRDGNRTDCIPEEDTAAAPRVGKGRGL